MDINKAFPSKYLKSDDIKGHEPEVIVASCEMEKVEGGDERPVLHFKGKDKGLIINKTNATMMVSLAGSPLTEQWTGTRVKLVVVWTEFGGKPIEGIRIRPTNNQPAQAQAPPPAPEVEPPSMDDIPFAWLLPLFMSVSTWL